jgi:hypothetical protein
MTRSRNLTVHLLKAMVFAAALFAARGAAAQTCDANHTVRWPDPSPVWEMCWTSPVDSTGIDGSGLEITNVKYNGKLVLGRGHIPVVNVKYDPGGCGGLDLSYRDWNKELVRFEANNVIRAGYAEPTTPPRTVCDTPGADVGTFLGVAAEKLADRLVLTTQVQAGWYRYIYTWTFFADGTIKPGVRFTAVDNPCTSLPHYHNIYWRFDLDIDDVDNDVIDEFNSGAWTPLSAETRRLHAPSTARRWRVRDKVTGNSYEILPSAEDEVADAWSIGDMWALAFRSTELDDGGATGGLDGDRAHIDRYLSGENLDGKDVVLWYRTGFRHAGPVDCEIGGPTLRPVRTPAATLTANGAQPIVTLGPADPLRLDVAFDAGPAGVVNPAEIYFGFAGPSGTYFLDPLLGFVPAQRRLYAGALPGFPASTLVNLPAAGTLPPGTYVWFVAVDGDTNGTMNATFFDYVVTVIRP